MEFKEYSNDENALIITDPHYLLSYNILYQNYNTNLYEFLCNNNIKQFKAKIILVLKNNWIIKLLSKTKNHSHMIKNVRYQEKSLQLEKLSISIV